MLIMRLPLLALVALLFQTASSAADQAATIDFAQKAAVRALGYTHGDRATLLDARDDFTPEGWRAFMKRMDGFLDAAGAPDHSSSFTPSGAAAVKSLTNGVMRLAIPGTLKQWRTTSAAGTTYRVTVEVQVGGTPPKIQLLEPVIELKR